MHILEFIKETSQDECREIGELILSFADSPRDANWRANMEAALSAVASPADQTRVQVIAAANRRVVALNDGLLADGTNHAKLLEEELARRGDKRNVREYAEAVSSGHLHSDVIHGDYARG